MSASGIITFYKGEEKIERSYGSLWHRWKLIKENEDVPYTICPCCSLNETSERFYDNRLYEYYENQRSKQMRQPVGALYETADDKSVLGFTNNKETIGKWQRV